jgi:hypothetical protein
VLRKARIEVQTDLSLIGEAVQGQEKIPDVGQIVEHQRKALEVDAEGSAAMFCG